MPRVCSRFMLTRVCGIVIPSFFFPFHSGHALYATEENIAKYGDGSTAEELADEQAEDDAALLVNKVRARSLEMA